jgi:hypothetical protein
MRLEFQKRSALKFVSRIDPAEGGGANRYPWLMKFRYYNRSAVISVS